MINKDHTSSGIKVIVTGATGMVGEGVLLECLGNDNVKSVLVINRKSCGISNPKLKEIIHADFFNLTAIEDQLVGYDACFFCLGVSSVGMKEPEYTTLTYTLTLNVASTLSRLNSQMVFNYVSGAGTDSTGQGRSMWARVKGKTENDLMKLPFKQVFAFRPGFLRATPGQKNVLSFYKYVSWLYPLIRKFFPGAASSIKELGQAMINVTLFGYNKHVLEVKDIVSVASIHNVNI